MNIEKRLVSELKPATYNPRKKLKPGDYEFEAIENSITAFGYVDPIIINSDNTVIGGHQRLKVIQHLGELDEVDVVVVDVDKTNEKALNIALNKISGEWDTDRLEDLVKSLSDTNPELMSITGFNNDEIDKLINEINNYADKDNKIGPLKDDFIISPFSIFDTKGGEWQERKKVWKSIINDKAETREFLLRPNMNKIENFGETSSLLDPVLAEIVNYWFNIPNGKCFDPFAGDSVYGFVSAFKGYDFIGIELRKDQAELNQKRLLDNNLSGLYINDDALNIDNYISDKSIDFLFSCPPYYDLEKYSDLDNDLSNKETYQEFNEFMGIIINKSLNKLKENRFAVFVVGDIRDKEGFYRGFIKDTIINFEKSGAKLYNEIILLDPISSGALRASNTMKNRKVVKIHQNILVFYKGNTKNIQNIFKNLRNKDIDLSDYYGS